MGFFPRATTDATACCSTTQPGRRRSTSWTRPCGGGRRAALPAPRARAVLSVLLFDPYISQRFKVLCFMGWLRWCAAMELFDSERGAGPGKMSSTAVWRVPMASSGSRLVSARAPGTLLTLPDASNPIDTAVQRCSCSGSGRVHVAVEANFWSPIPARWPAARGG